MDKKPGPPTDIATDASQSVGTVVCYNSDGLELRGLVLRLTPHAIAFEIYGAAEVVRMSEVLTDLKVFVDQEWLACGRAVVSGLVHTGNALVCEATLSESCFEAASVSGTEPNEGMAGKFKGFLNRWQSNYRVLPEFKAVVADIRSLLGDLRIWLDRIELGIRANPSGDRVEQQQDVTRELGPTAVRTIDTLYDRFEEIGRSLDESLRAVHIHFARRQLHPLLLCSPFAYRTYYKPLGYAGDYEMVQMILRDPYEGSSLFAKIINAWFLDQLPAQAHRNRIDYLVGRLVDEAARTRQAGHAARIYDIGCGPATEIERFLHESLLADWAEFKLLDFNEETIQHVSSVLAQAKRTCARRTPIEFQKKAVQHILKDAARSAATQTGKQFDLIYCAGLFDYLPDRVCKQLLDAFYGWLAPEGLLIVTNVSEASPFRNKLEFILDWSLIYRTGRELSALAPARVPPDALRAMSDATGVNVFIEIRKPQSS